MTSPAISVALCTCNGARYLPRQVRSICAQEPPPREIVLSDDASEDGSVEAAQQALAGAPIELVVLRNPERLGVTRNFEQAVRACRHELIALSDQDDEWHPGRLRRMTEAFQARADLLLLHSDARLVDAQGAPLGGTLFHALRATRGELRRIHAGAAFDVFLHRNLATGATTVFRRALLQAALPFPPECVHDEWLGLIAAATGGVDAIEEALIDYRQHGGNQIGARRLSFAETVRKALSSRGTFHIDRACKTRRLLERLEALAGQVAPPTLEKVRAKLEHHTFRATLPASRLARCAPVLREALTGRYGRFGRGLRGVVRDLLEAV